MSFAPREEEGFTYHEDSNWLNMLFVGGYEFLDPPPQITPNGIKYVDQALSGKRNAA